MDTAEKKLDISKVPVGTIIGGKYLSGIKAKILLIEEEKNNLKVECKNTNGSTWNEDWNLQHTIWGFEIGEYCKEKEY